MKKIFLAVIAVIVVLAGGLMLSYNGLAGSKEAVETAEADVDTMLQRRADLIPNLVSTVKSYTKHEKGVVDRVLEARDQLMMQIPWKRNLRQISRWTVHFPV